VCRNIHTLRPPFVENVTDYDIEAAALQYVRKVAGMRSPSSANAEAFQQAVDAVAAATSTLLDQLVLRPSTSKHARQYANATAHKRPEPDDHAAAVD
jgi:hypothetical protein